MLLPASDLVKIALGTMEMPTTNEEWIKIAVSTVLDCMPGGKMLRLLKSSAVKRIDGHILKLATKRAKKAIDVKFLDKKELAKRLNIKIEQIHPVKKEITSRFKDLLSKKGIKNPDICVDKAGNIVLRHPVTKEAISTGVPLSTFAQ